MPSAAGVTAQAPSAARDLAQALRAARAAHFSARGDFCDYAALAACAARERIAASLASLAKFDPRTLDAASQAAFWLNAYNACVLRDAPQFFCAGSVRAADSFFDSPRVVVAGHSWSLDDIEHGLLRGAPKYGRLRAPIEASDPRLRLAPPLYDERVHFGMYSACRSSPPLHVFAGAELEEQLEAAAREHIRRTVSITADGAVVRVPKLFQWYADDFGGRSGVLEFVLARIDDEALIEVVDRRLGRVELEYLEYDWTLNTGSV